MRVFKRESIYTHCAGSEWPGFLGEVELGESFVIETERLNYVNGPVGLRGIEAGDDIAVHVEGIEILPPFLAPNGGPFFGGPESPTPGLPFTSPGKLTRLAIRDDNGPPHRLILCPA